MAANLQCKIRSRPPLWLGPFIWLAFLYGWTGITLFRWDDTRVDRYIDWVTMRVERGLVVEINCGHGWKRVD